MIDNQLSWNVSLISFSPIFQLCLGDSGYSTNLASLLCQSVICCCCFFSCFPQRFTSINDVLISCARRSLAYPLYRHWSLVVAVLEDTKKIFSLGKVAVL